MQEPMIELERALAVFVDACETYMSDQRPQTFDEMERACLDAKKLIVGKAA